MTRFILALLAAVVLGGCAWPVPIIPESYAGPTAVIADSGVAQDTYTSRIFYVHAIDGERLQDHVVAGRNPSFNGNEHTLARIERRIAAQPVTLTLVGRHVVEGPLRGFMARSRSAYQAVEGDVTFTPAPGGRYKVDGLLANGNSSVWLVDEKTGQRVAGPVVSAR